MTDKPSADKPNEHQAIKTKPIQPAKILSYINDYSPLVEELAHDDRFAEKKFRKSCAELLEIKDKCENDHSFISNHQDDLLLAWSIYRKFKVIAKPFTEKVTERTVNDIKVSTNSNNWEEVMRDLSFLSEINKAQVRKFPPCETAAEKARSDNMNRQEIKEINEQLHACQWLPDVTLEGIYYQDGKNLEFNVKGATIFIHPNGMRVINPEKEDPESFAEYLKKNGIDRTESTGAQVKESQVPAATAGSTSIEKNTISTTNNNIVDAITAPEVINNGTQALKTQQDHRQ